LTLGLIIFVLRIPVFRYSSCHYGWDVGHFVSNANFAVDMAGFSFILLHELSAVFAVRYVSN